MSFKDIIIQFDFDNQELKQGETLTTRYNDMLLFQEYPNGIEFGKIGSYSPPKSPPIPRGISGIAYMMSYILAANMYISMSRIYDQQIIPTFSSDGFTVTNIKFQASINNIVSSNSAQPNDYLAAECIANWWQLIAETRNLLTPMPKCVLPPIPEQFKSDIPDNFENNIQTNTNVVERFLPLNIHNNKNLSPNLIEHATNITIISVPPRIPVGIPANKPSFLLDYILQYTYPIAFLGATLYGITSIISVDATSIIANKNISVLLNSLAGLCGYLGLCYFYNIPIVILTNLFNPGVIKLSNLS